MKQFQKLPKLSPGDQVGVISPSAGLPGIFPWVQDLGLTRMREVFKLNPIEYPTTRTMGAPLKDRARDIMAAFADPNNKAVFTSVGGSDQIRLIKYLDPQIFLDNPKPFFGYSDNTPARLSLEPWYSVILWGRRDESARYESRDVPYDSYVAQARLV